MDKLVVIKNKKRRVYICKICGEEFGPKTKHPRALELFMHAADVHKLPNIEIEEID